MEAFGAAVLRAIADWQHREARRAEALANCWRRVEAPPADVPPILGRHFFRRAELDALTWAEAAHG